MGELFLQTPPRLLWGLGGVLAALTLGALAAVALPILRPGKDYANLRAHSSRGGVCRKSSPMACVWP